MALQLKSHLTSSQALIYPAVTGLYGIVFEKHKATVVLLTDETDVQKSTQRPTW